MHCLQSGSSSCDPSWPSAWKQESPWPNSDRKPTVPGTSNRMVWSGNCKRGWMGRVPDEDIATPFPPESPWPCSTEQLGISPPRKSRESPPTTRHWKIARLERFPSSNAEHPFNNSKHWWDWPRRRVKSVVSWIIPSRFCMAIGIQKSSHATQKAGCRAFWISMRFGWMRWPTSWPTRCSTSHSDDRKTSH